MLGGIVGIVVFLLLFFYAAFYNKGAAGERSVARRLATLPKEQYVILNDLLLPTSYGTTQIDHVVVSIYGIFVIETKNYKGIIYGGQDAETWTHIADYNVPDIVRDVITEPWQSPGYKPIDIRLPSTMLGKEKVFIRLMPKSRKGSSVVYLDSSFSNGSYSAMNYFAIRYNK